MSSVRLKGGGGAVWTFDLPLSPAFAAKVRRRELAPADEESRALLAGSEEEGQAQELDDLLELSKGDLKEIAEGLDLPVSGNKAEIAERILEARSAGGSEEEPSEDAESDEEGEG